MKKTSPTSGASNYATASSAPLTKGTTSVVAVPAFNPTGSNISAHEHTGTANLLPECPEIRRDIKSSISDLSPQQLVDAGYASRVDITLKPNFSHIIPEAVHPQSDDINTVTTAESTLPYGHYPMGTYPYIGDPCGDPNLSEWGKGLRGPDKWFPSVPVGPQFPLPMAAPQWNVLRWETGNPDTGRELYAVESVITSTFSNGLVVATCAFKEHADLIAKALNRYDDSPTKASAPMKPTHTVTLNHAKDTLKDASGRILTLVDASIPGEAQNKALKTLIKGIFRAKITELWEFCHRGTPNDESIDFGEGLKD